MRLARGTCGGRNLETSWDLLQLEHFLAVVEEGTFTRAAERVCRTQPAVSQSIKKLEEEVGRRSSPVTSTRYR